MDGEKKRPARSTSVVAGSVWESRMKMDQIKGGIKVFVANATDEAAVVGSLERRKRKSWKPVDNGRSNSNDLRKTLSALLPAQVDGDSDDADEDDGFEVEVEDKKVDQIWLEESIAPSSVSKEENLHPESPPTGDDGGGHRTLIFFPRGEILISVLNFCCCCCRRRFLRHHFRQLEQFPKHRYVGRPSVSVSSYLINTTIID